jgi:hypothetical protein
VLGACLAVRGRAEEARQLLASSVRILDAAWGPEHPETKLARQRLADLAEPERRSAGALRRFP